MTTLLPQDFHPVVQRWWASRFAEPTDAQLEGWSAIRRGEHTLIAAPTGSGKTLAAFLTAIDQLLREAKEQGGLPDEVRVIYVSPLKALSADIHKNPPEPRRGAHLALSLERLDHVCGRPLQRIGLSATQKPIEEVARFLKDGAPCSIVDRGHQRRIDLAIEVPKSPLEAVMSGEVWQEIYE